jgi:hypothetical protein
MESWIWLGAKRGFGGSIFHLAYIVADGAPMSVDVATKVLSAIGGIITPIILVLLARQSANVKKIEVATNSMKDALVAATAKASEREGHAAGLEQGRAENK